jgi:hypothetical protein
MTRATKAVCPHCNTPLKSNRGVRVGKEVSCPQCSRPFTVGPGAAAPAGRPPRVVNYDRLVVALIAGLHFLFGGGALACYCLVLNARRPAVVEAAPPPSTQEEPKEEKDEPPPPPPPPLSPAASGDPVEERRTDDAIVKGVWFLRDRQQGDGAWGNGYPVAYASLGGLTLLECGIPASDPAVQKCATLVRQQAGELGDDKSTYQRALAILFLDRLNQATDDGLVSAAPALRTKGAAGAAGDGADDDDLIQYLALCLVAGQNPSDGGWSYTSPALERYKTQGLLLLLRDDHTSLAGWREAAGAAGFNHPVSDNSNTQFATLALWVARRHGVAVGRTIRGVEERFRTTQLPEGPDPTGHNLNLDGAWPYNAQLGMTTNQWPSMTCSGLLGLAVAYGVEQAGGHPGKPLDDRAIRRGLGMLGREIDRPDESRPPDLYFLWSLERVAVLYHLDRIEHKDWYAWGRKVLLDHQEQNGSWSGGTSAGNNPILDTCFALLFLKRANLAPDLTTKLQLLSKEK